MRKDNLFKKTPPSVPPYRGTVCRKHSLRFILFFYATQFCATVSFSQNIAPGTDVISIDSLMKTVTFLSSKQFEGRNPGTKGYDDAARYMASKFSEMKLKPLGDSVYFQWLNLECNEIISPYKFNLIEKDKIVKQYNIGTDFVFRGFTGAGTMKAPVVFCGYGISDTVNGYDDFRNADFAKEKIVMIFKPNPKWKNGDVAWPDANERSKAQVAIKHGAKAILMVSLPNDEKPQKTIGSTLHGEGMQPKNFPMLHISLDAANDILKKSGYTIKQLQTLIDSTKKPFSVNTNSVVDLQANTRYDSVARTENIIGMIEGSDPALKNQYVLIGAHLDHVGQQAGEIYFPGANDNASGSAAVLEIARVFSEEKFKPKRSVIFVLFASEEQGLLGSKFMASHLPVPVDSVVAAINMDCIGYGDSIQIGNGKSTPELWKFIHTIDSASSNLMVQRTWNGGGADLGAFHDKGIPGAYFVTTNSYVHLHWLTDTPETLNRKLYESIMKLAYQTLYKLSMGEYKREKVIK